MMYINKFSIKFLIIFTLGASFLSILHDYNYPDNEILVNRLYSNHQDLDYSPQKLVVQINKYISKFKPFDNKNENQIKQNSLATEMSGYNRLSFFIPTFLVIFLLIMINKAIGSLEKSKFYKSITDTYLISLVFPSIILCYTAIGSEAIYNVLILFIVANLSHQKLSVLRIMLLLPILFYAFLLDRGNFFVLFSFLVGLYTLLFLNNYVSKNYLFIILLLIFFFTISVGSEVFYFVGTLLDSEKMTGLIFEVEKLNLNSISFLDLIKRYIYFWLTLLNVYFSNHVFSPISLTIIICLIGFLSSEIYRDKEKRMMILNLFSDNRNFLTVSWMIFFPIFVISILPTHAYYKYYIFYIVYLIKILSLFYTNNRIFNLFLCITIFYLIEVQLKSLI